MKKKQKDLLANYRNKYYRRNIACVHDNDDKCLDHPEIKKEICDIAKFAIDEHNKSIEQSGKKYVFEDVLSVRMKIGSVYQYTITFTAMEIEETGGEPKLRTIEAYVCNKELIYNYLKYFKVMSDSDTEGDEDKITVQP